MLPASSPLLKDYSHPVRAAFEATGHYHRALAYHLVTTGFEVKLVSSVDLARARAAPHIRWDNNDPRGCSSHPPHDGILDEQVYHGPLLRWTNDIQ